MAEELTSSSAVEKTRQNCNTDWRAQKSDFVEQMAHLCMSEEMADVEFVFNRGGEITVCCFIIIHLSFY